MKSYYQSTAYSCYTGWDPADFAELNFSVMLSASLMTVLGHTDCETLVTAFVRGTSKYNKPSLRENLWDSVC